MTKPSETRFRKYWKVNNRVIAVLLTVWGLVSLGGGVLFVKQLNAFSFFGLPLGFWIAQQGAIYVFILIIFVYARVMDAVDHRYKMDK
jgi:putative solute:sodium symporter small subunit